jgi:hypothetical protein
MRIVDRVAPDAEDAYFVVALLPCRHAHLDSMRSDIFSARATRA